MLEIYFFSRASLSSNAINSLSLSIREFFLVFLEPLHHSFKKEFKKE